MADLVEVELWLLYPDFSLHSTLSPNCWGFFTWWHMFGAKCIKCVRICTTLGWVSKDQRLTRLIHYPSGIIITFTYIIPFVGLTHLVRTPHEEISNFPITIGIGHVRYKFQGRLSKKKICKSPSMLRSPRACNNKRTCQGKVPDDFHSLAPQHFIPNKYPPSVWGYLENRDI